MLGENSMFGNFGPFQITSKGNAQYLVRGFMFNELVVNKKLIVRPVRRGCLRAFDRNPLFIVLNYFYFVSKH